MCYPYEVVNNLMETMAKTNKAFLKRIKVTRNGKLLRRKGGQNHFRAKEPRSGQLAKKGLFPFLVGKEFTSRHLINS